MADGEFENIETAQVDQRTGELIVQESYGPVAKYTEDELKQVLVRAKYMKVLRQLTLEQLSENDFHRFGANFWMEKSGVSKVTLIYGLAWDNPVTSDLIWDETEAGKRYFYYKSRVRCWFPRDKRYAWGFGSARSNDDLWKNENPGDLDKMDIQKKAETNARANALINLGINFTEDEIKAAGSIDTSKMTGHDYKQGTKGGKSAASSAGGPSQKQWDILSSLVKEKVDPQSYPAKQSADTLIAWFKSQTFSGKDMFAINGWLMEKKGAGVVECEDVFTWLEQAGLFKPAPSAGSKGQAPKREEPPIDDPDDFR